VTQVISMPILPPVRTLGDVEAIERLSG